MSFWFFFLFWPWTFWPSKDSGDGRISQSEWAILDIKNETDKRDCVVALLCHLYSLYRHNWQTNAVRINLHSWGTFLWLDWRPQLIPCLLYVDVTFLQSGVFFTVYIRVCMLYHHQDHIQIRSVTECRVSFFLFFIFHFIIFLKTSVEQLRLICWLMCFRPITLFQQKKTNAFCWPVRDERNSCFPRNMSDNSYWAWLLLILAQAEGCCHPHPLLRGHWDSFQRFLPDVLSQPHKAKG